MTQSVCYYSLYGRFSDSPRAIYEELVSRGGEYEHVWLVKDEHVEVSGPARTVVLDTAASRAAVAAADFVVANTYLDDHPTKAGVHYLQTWHGTPLKRIGLDNPTSPAYDREVLLPRRVAQWNYLVSPNPFSTHKLSSAFAFAKSVLETGYPRNDVLSSPSSATIRHRLRADLGFNDNKTAVLYAPTWRDLTYEDDLGSLQRTAEELQSRLGDRFVVLLRSHYFVGSLQASATDATPTVIDVSGYGDISDLYLAADILLTDYSSSMFDFAVTGKPMVFFTHDLDDYRDTTRGFYFDFVGEAPGPLVFDTTQVVAALKDESLSAKYAERYNAFRQKFCPWDDGKASARVVDAVFGTQQ